MSSNTPAETPVLKDPHLSARVRLFGDILGDVLKSQEHPAVLRTVQSLRRGFIKLRIRNDEKLRSRMLRQINRLDPDLMTRVIRAFSVFFSLTNIAEEASQHRLRRQRVRSGKRLWHGSFDATFRELVASGLTAPDLQTLFDQLGYRPVFTAHPTEIKRRAIMIAMRRIFLTAEKLNDPRHSREQRQELRDALETQIQILWKTNEVRALRPHVRDEIRTGLYYFRESLFSAVPQVYRYIERAAARSNVDIRIPSFLKFGSWIGGDRDGNPYVLPETTEYAVRMQAAEILREYIERVGELRQILTHSYSLCQPSDELMQNISSADPKLVDMVFKARPDQFRDEPYRRLLSLIQRRLRLTRQSIMHPLGGVRAPELPGYAHQDEFLNDLYIIRESLIGHGDEKVASAELKDLIRLAETFGFNLVNLDLRQESTRHTTAVSEIIRLQLDRNYDELDEKDKLELLGELISSGQCSNPLSRNLSEDTRETIEVFYVMERLQREVSPHAFGEYVISMTHAASHIMEVMFLASLCGLAGRKDNNWYCRISISPLFETINDLEHIEPVLNSLLYQPVYRSLLESSCECQEVMLGYSDSCKDGGIMASVWSLYQAQLVINRLSKQHGIRIRLFHGRGGTMARGGGPTHETILAYPPGTVQGETKFTEQGEVLFYKYNNPETATYELGVGMTGLIKASAHLVGQPRVIPDHYVQTMDSLAELGERCYRELMDGTEGLIDYFYEATPVTEIGLMNIGSRPSHRAKQDRSKNSLRAIPWVFGWAQSRHTLPAWFGIGTALEQWCGDDEEKLKLLMTMYRDWPFFHSFMSNTQMALFKGEMEIAECYSRLVANRRRAGRIYHIIRSEYERTVKWVKSVAQIRELMEETPDIQLSLTRRNPYLDPLNHIQISLLRRYRDESLPDDERDRWLAPLLSSINGIASGMRNTG